MNQLVRILFSLLFGLAVTAPAWAADDTNKTYEICSDDILEKTVEELFPESTTPYLNDNNYRFFMKVEPDTELHGEVPCNECTTLTQSFCNLDSDRTEHTFTLTLTRQRKRWGQWKDDGNKKSILVTVIVYRKPNIKFGNNPLN